MKEYNPGPPNRVSQWLVTIAVLVVVTACALTLVHQWTPEAKVFHPNINIPLYVNNEPFGVTTGPDRQLWFTYGSQIAVMTTSGQGPREFSLPNEPQGDQ